MLDREDKAHELLKEAGFGPDNPLNVEIRYNTSREPQEHRGRHRRHVEAASAST